MNREKYSSFIAGGNDNGRRADRIIRQFIPEKSLGGLYKAFRKGLIRVNGKKIQPESKILEGDVLEIYKALLDNARKEEAPSQGISNINLTPLMETEDLLALNKPKGILVHGGDNSLEKQVGLYLEGKLPPSLSFKPGPLHRLDRNTSGLIFFSKSLEGAKDFSRRLQEGDFKKFYLTLIDGKLKNKEVWVDNLQRDGKSRTSSVKESGSEARSTFIPLRYGGNKTLTLVVIETGRTHQIRAQAAFHGHPLSGDGKYGGSFLKGGYFLHSLTLKSRSGDFPGTLPIPEAPLTDKQWKIVKEIFRDIKAEQLNTEIKRFLEDQ